MLGIVELELLVGCCVLRILAVVEEDCDGDWLEEEVPGLLLELVLGALDVVLELLLLLDAVLL